MTVKTEKRHCRGSKSKAKKIWEKREQLSKKKSRHEGKKKDKNNENTENIVNDECVVCYEEVPIIKNNILKCNKIINILCADCKMRLINDRRDCPLCRGHHIPHPSMIMVPYYIKIYKR